MRTIHRLIEADKTRKENGEAGFSLIELIIVVVVLGILAAIAIPIFLNIQQQAKDSAVESITGNAATQAASAFAQNKSYVAAGATAGATDEFDLLNLTKGTSPAVVLTLTGTTPDGVCVEGSGGGSKYTSAAPYKSGPGCS